MGVQNLDDPHLFSSNFHIGSWGPIKFTNSISHPAKTCSSFPHVKQKSDTRWYRNAIHLVELSSFFINAPDLRALKTSIFRKVAIKFPNVSAFSLLCIWTQKGENWNLNSSKDSVGAHGQSPDILKTYTKFIPAKVIWIQNPKHLII